MSETTVTYKRWDGKFCKKNKTIEKVIIDDEAT